MNDQQMHDLLSAARTIAVVGHSDDPSRTSYQIASFLRRAGYVVFAVNPTIAEAAGRPVYATLADIPVHVDIVNVFRRSEYLPDVAREAAAIGAKAVWAQLGVEHRDAVDIAQAANMALVMDKCIKVEYMRLDVERDHEELAANVTQEVPRPSLLEDYPEDAG
ncbi:MAG: CoA-binding protein [Chloroflexi bacterium]|nr:CoA-binding protein [Chloroflexota bacterium]